MRPKQASSCHAIRIRCVPLTPLSSALTALPDKKIVRYTLFVFTFCYGNMQFP